MKVAVDSSVLIAALVVTQGGHEASRQVLDTYDCTAHVHALAETFNILTGSRLGFRVPAREAAEMLRLELLPRMTFVELGGQEVAAALIEAESRGVRGGAIFDFLHLVAAKKVSAEKLYTLDVQDFRHFHRPGDPDILKP
jgi:predicted nucleic acid-binding protein